MGSRTMIANEGRTTGVDLRRTDTSQVVLDAHKFRYVLQVLLSLLFLQFILRKEQNDRLIRYWTKVQCLFQYCDAIVFGTV